VDTYLERNRFFGSTELVGLLTRAAGVVQSRVPGSRLAVGELSREGGGRVIGHRSHQNGRDADLGFYFKSEDGDAPSPEQFLRVGRRGIAFRSEGTLRFDLERNWALVEALLRDRRVPVQHIFVSRRIRMKLLRHARRTGVSDAIREQASFVLMPPGRGVQSHNDHFHVRIYCAPRDQRVCRDRGPWWDWIPSTHQRLTDRPVPTVARR